jgi:hypothetical protein
MDVKFFTSQFEKLLGRMYGEFLKNPKNPELWSQLLPVDDESDWKVCMSFYIYKKEGFFL